MDRIKLRQSALEILIENLPKSVEKRVTIEQLGDALLLDYDDEKHGSDGVYLAGFGHTAVCVYDLSRQNARKDFNEAQDKDTQFPEIAHGRKYGILKKTIDAQRNIGYVVTGWLD